MTGPPGQHRRPERHIGWLLAGAKEKYSIGSQKPVDAGKERLARFEREGKHYVAQKNHIEPIAGSIKGQSRCAQVCLAKVAHVADLAIVRPLLAIARKAAHQVAGRETTGHL